MGLVEFSNATKPVYINPEQVCGLTTNIDKDDPRTDIYVVGADMPFTVDGNIELVHGILVER